MARQVNLHSFPHSHDAGFKELGEEPQARLLRQAWQWETLSVRGDESAFPVYFVRLGSSRTVS